MPFRNPLGGLPALPPAAPALTFLFFPHPPAPFPSGEGGDFLVFLCKGLRPLHPPELSRKRHWLTLPLWHPAGSLPGWSPDDYAFPESTGGLACFAARRPRLDLSLFPHPPSPLPLRGRGRFFGFLMQGASPLASLGTEPGRHLQSLPPHLPGGGLAPAAPALPAVS